MQIQTSDVLVRVRGLESLAMVVNERSLDAKAFNLVMRNLYSNMWIMIDPSVFCFKLQETPKNQVRTIIERLAKQRLANVYRCDDRDMTRSVYLIIYNPRFITRTSRRKSNIFIMSMMSKQARQLTGDTVIIDKDKCGEYWSEMVKRERISNGNTNAEYRANMKAFDWVRVL